MSRKVLIAAGGTGGHVIPGLSVANELQSRGVCVEWIGTSAGIESNLVPKAGLALHIFNVSGIRGKGQAAIILAPFKIINSIFMACTQIKAVKPDLVIGMGGFVAGPVGAAAKLLGVPLMIHEQNSVAGTTNKILAKMANRVLTAFPCGLTKETVMGNPIRAELERIAEPKLRNLGGNKKIRVLVLGGSRGAKALNTVVAKQLDELADDFELALWHQCGKGRKSEAEGSYNSKAVRIDEFISSMDEAYLWADILICRSGALTVSELMAVGLPSILIPFPYAIDDHQTKNAEFLERSDAATIIQERDMHSSSIRNALKKYVNDRSLLIERGTNARNAAKPGAVLRIADVAEELMA